MKLKKNLVSVIGTSFGDKPLNTIKAIESVLKQNYSHIEVIVILPPYKNNLEIFKKYKKKIKIVVTKQLYNLPKSLNLALKYASGEYIARIDFDDYYLQDKLRKQVNFLKNNNNVSVLGTGYEIKHSKKKIIMPSGYPYVKIYSFFFNPLCHPSIMFRAKLLREWFKYDPVFFAA